MKRYSTLEFEIETLNNKGQGLTHYEDYLLNTPYALPGQKVLAKVVKKKRKRAETKLVQVLEHRGDEIASRCEHFGQPPEEGSGGCGGCHWQQLPYASQLDLKATVLKQALAPLIELGMVLPEIQTMIASPSTWGYRNKMEFSFGDKTYISDEKYQAFRERKAPLPKGQFLGLHAPKSFGTIIDVGHCHLLSAPMQAVYETCRKGFLNLGGEVYNQKHHTGFWRHLVLREGVQRGEIMVHFNTTDTHTPDWSVLVNELLALDLNGHKVTSILHSVHTGNAQIVGHNPPTVLAGEPFIHDDLCGLSFRISPYAFFQTNTLAAEQLYQYIVKLCAFEGNEVVYDLYSGTGTIGMVLAQHGAGKVYGIEEIETAVIDAHANAQRNQILNCEFLAGRVEAILPDLIQSASPDWVILDPPRAGLHPKVPKLLNQLRVKQLIYVSCNPQALAQDLEQFCLEGPYQLNSIQPVDLFPHTPHLETVVYLSLKP